MPTKMESTKERPSSRLALVCASILSEHSRNWLTAPVGELCRREGIRLDRLSRLKSRVREGMESLVGDASKPGRRSQVPADPQRVKVLEAMLDISASLIRRVPLHQRHLQDHLVHAFERVRGEQRISARNFCRMLGLRERTFRSWRSRPVRLPDPQPPASKPERKKRPKGRQGRFSLFDLLPGVLAHGDTTDITLLEVPLKFIGLQDPGNRRRKLFEGYGLYTRENAQAVIDVVRNGLEPGTVFTTDQGSPYMAEAAQAAYEELELDHAPAREGMPTDKATLERSFGTLKQALAPLLALSNQLARVVPGLKKPALALPLGKLLVAVFLRVWFMAAAPGPHPLEGASCTELRIIAEQMREDARQEQASKRLLLGNIHDAYGMEGSRERFIRAHARHWLADIQEAEEALRSKACRCQVHCCDRYFAGILRNVAAKNKRIRDLQRQDERNREQRQAEWKQIHNEGVTREQNPQWMLYEGLDALAAAWIPEQNKLLFGGIGPGRALLYRAMELLAEKDPLSFVDTVHVVWKAWQQHNPDFDPQGIQAMKTVFDFCLAQNTDANVSPSREPAAYAIFKGESLNNRRSPPS